MLGPPELMPILESTWKVKTQVIELNPDKVKIKTQANLNLHKTLTPTPTSKLTTPLNKDKF